MSAPTVAVTRRYRFPAAHVLRHPSFSDAENERVYGKCANPAGHGHDYGIEVTVTGRTETTHRVTASPEYRQRLGLAHVPAERLIRKSFEFLLEREDNTSILATFDLPLIGHYFPEYEQTIAILLQEDAT